MQAHSTLSLPQHEHSHGRATQRSAARRARASRLRAPQPRRAPLATYTDADGQPREVITRPGVDGSVLVIDREAGSRVDARLLAHLASDEPTENAALVCRDYLRRVDERDRRCRALAAEDALVAPLPDAHELAAGLDLRGDTIELAMHGFLIERVGSRMSIPELRWRRTDGKAPASRATVSMREAVATLESYEPLRTVTAHALASHRDDETTSTTTLRAELTRVQDSPIVLNRGLREVVLAAVEGGELSMSEIAMRCGRIKRDCHGNESGETSWLARRVGLLPEGGQSAPTPWVHIDVLALIARDGLGISPREVELGAGG